MCRAFLPHVQKIGKMVLENMGGRVVCNFPESAGVDRNRHQMIDVREQGNLRGNSQMLRSRSRSRACDVVSV